MDIQEIKQIIALGVACEREGRWQEAERHWQSLLPDTESKFWGQLRLGRTYYAQSRFSEAADILREAISINPGHAYAQEMFIRSVVLRDGFVEEPEWVVPGSLPATGHSVVQSLLDSIHLLKRCGLKRSGFDHPVYAYIDHDTPIYDVAAHDGSISAVLNIGAHSVVMPGDWDLLGTRFEEFEVYRAIESVLVSRVCEWTDTDFYKSNVSRIQSGDHVWNCDSEQAFRVRLSEDVPRLPQSIAAVGLLPQSEVGGWDPMDDIRLGVGRSGDLIFLNGQHRLAIAKLLKLTKIPVRIVVRHAEWEALRGEIESYKDRAGGQVYQQIPHADLVHIPAVHQLERLWAVSRSVEGLGLSSGSLLDIGIHWGAVPMLFSRAGFFCDAVENHPEYLPFLRRLTSSRGSGIRIMEGSVFDLGDYAGYDVIVALNILHHFLRTEQSFAALKAMLARIEPGVMYVQTHNPDTIDRMDDYHAPMTVVQFLDFIVEHSAFNRYTEIYRESDGRPIFLFS